MPFTLAHPAAVAPVWLASRKRLPLPALVIGAMSPDFEYLIRLAPRGEFAHQPLGIVLFCVPATLFVLLAYEAVLREPLVRLFALPARLAARPPATVAWWTGAAIAALAGAGTHVLWDGFTHGDGWLVMTVAELRTTAFWGMRWFVFWQRLSTLVGAIVIGAWIWSSEDARRSLRTVIASPRRRVTILALVALAAVCALANAFRATGVDLESDALVRFLAFGAVGGMVGLALGLFGFGFWCQLSRSGAPFGCAPEPRADPRRREAFER